MKYLSILVLLMIIFTSCGGNNENQPEQEISEELIEETKFLETETEVLDQTIQKIETSTDELDKMLEEL